MSFDDVMLWLVTAMGCTAVAFLLWTAVALIRNSGRASFAVRAELGRSRDRRRG